MMAPAATITARLTFMGDLHAVIGQRSLELEVPAGCTVRDLLGLLSQTYGEPFTARVFSKTGKMQHYILIFVDGESINGRGGPDSKLGSGDVDVIMLPMFVGG